MGGHERLASMAACHVYLLFLLLCCDFMANKYDDDDDDDDNDDGDALIKMTRNLADANISCSASAVSGLQPIAVRHHACIIAKNSALLYLCCNHR